MSFIAWFANEEFDLVNYPDTAVEAGFAEGMRQAAVKCREIAQQRFLEIDQAVSIDEDIAKEFNL